MERQGLEDSFDDEIEPEICTTLSSSPYRTRHSRGLFHRREKSPRHPGQTGVAGLAVAPYHVEMRLVCLVVCAVGALSGPALGDRSTARSTARATARSLTEEAGAHHARGHSDRALRLCERAIAADPDYLPAYELATPLWLAQRDYSSVMRHFERLTLRYPDYAFGWYTLAFAYRLAGRAANAIAAYEFYIEIRPDEAAPYFGLAMAYKSAERPREAVGAFQRYIELERDPRRQDFVDQAHREIRDLSTPKAEIPVLIRGRRLLVAGVLALWKPSLYRTLLESRNQLK